MDENHDIDAQSGVPTDPTPVVPRADVTWELPAQPAGGWSFYGAAAEATPEAPTDPYPGVPGGTAGGAPAYGPTPPATQAPTGHEPHVYAGYGVPASWAPGAGAAEPPPPPPPWAGRPYPGAGGAEPPPPSWGGMTYPSAGPPGSSAPTAGARAGRGGRVKALRVGAALLVVGATTAAGIGIGHDLWNTRQPSSNQSAVGNNSTGSNGNGSTGSNGTGSNGATGNNGNGSTGNGGLPFGNGFPFGNTGNGSTGNGNTGSGGPSSSSGSPSNVSAIAASVSPDLVDINTNLYQDGSAAGTGIVISSNGEVLTNNHVIEGATTITATDVGNGQTYKATVVGYDRTSDIAVVQLQDASGLKTAPLGDSSRVTVGMGVVAIGNAGGVGGTPSAAGGSVTALDQTITASDQGGGNAEQLNGMIEINAAIQPGDSGGSLVNSSGQVVGIDTAAQTGSQFTSSGNQGYAIPINTALTIAQQIVAGQGSSTVHIGKTAFLGVGVQAPTTGTAGAQVSEVVSGGAAASAGIVVGDTITSLGGQAVNAPDGLTAAIEPHHPGDSVQVTWVTSSGQQESGTVTFGNGPAA